jgi:hypothetical protein
MEAFLFATNAADCYDAAPQETPKAVNRAMVALVRRVTGSLMVLDSAQTRTHIRTNQEQ